MDVTFVVASLSGEYWNMAVVLTTLPSLEFHFDFISPFGYFASLRIDEIAARHAREVEWQSMLVGISVLKVMGLKPIPETPLKGDYARRDAERYCRRHGIKLAREFGAKPSNPLAAGRSFHWARQYSAERAKPLAQALLAAYWTQGRDIGDLETVLDIAAESGIDRSALADAHARGEASDLLKAAVDRSLGKGVFGSPFFIVDSEPFFGVEKMELMEEWLATGGW
ncbi:2-hydroxychromene-2-carboxylate isomerase [Mesorhizobium sp. CAU 1741]|uniref:2-hydroxychromene-2-carboxylate isomerase n=1 Tax=Mesorhizobium sp. CAU 1741 TaxID=3140366 RepID=UPI00325BE2C5